MLAFPRPREIGIILKHTSSRIFISMCLEYCLTFSSYHRRIKLALEMYCLVMINAKDDAYAVCSLTLANKLLIQMCLLTCCAMSEFIQAVPVKMISVWRRTELKRFIAWISTTQDGRWHSLALVLPKLTGACFNSPFTIQALHWPLTEEKNYAYYPSSVLNIPPLIGHLRLPFRMWISLFSHILSLLFHWFSQTWDCKKVNAKSTLK